MSFETVIDAGSCNCCGGGGLCELLCSTRGGTAQYIGYATFTTVSPPQFYRKKANAGAAATKAFIDSNCLLLDHTINCSYGGVCQYNKDTGVLTLSGSEVCDGVTVSTGCVDLGSDCVNHVTFTALKGTRHNTTDCCISGTNFLKGVSDSATVTLSDQDLPQDAINRLIAGAGGVWTDFFTTGQCQAVWGIVNDGTSHFGYNEAKYKISASALQPLTDYTGTVSVWRKAQGDPDFTLFETHEIDFVSNEVGAYISDEVDVPNEEGFTTYAEGCSIVLRV